MTKALIPKQKVQKLMIEIGGVWYMKTIDMGLPPLQRHNLSKKAQDKKTIKIYEDNKWWNDWIFR